MSPAHAGACPNPPVGTVRRSPETPPIHPIAALRRRFPGLVFWFGPHTRSWWALVAAPQGWRLVEAMNPDELTRAVLTTATWPDAGAYRTTQIVGRAAGRATPGSAGS